MQSKYFRPELIEFEQERIISADIHGNESALYVFLDDVNNKHRERIGNALIDTIDPNAQFGKLNGGAMRKYLRNIHKSQAFVFDPSKPKMTKEGFDQNKKILNTIIDFWATRLPEPKIYGLGDYLNYFGQSREVLTGIKARFHSLAKGNHDAMMPLAASGMSAEMLMQSLGISQYAAECAVAAGKDLTMEDINLLNSLPDEIKIGPNATGSHCDYDENGTPLYPISRRVAEREDYFFKNKKSLATLCQEPQERFKEAGFKKGKDIKFQAHAHLPVVAIFDESGNLVLEDTPGNLDVGTQEEEKNNHYFLARFTLDEGHKANVCVGGLGISRRKDRTIEERMNARGNDLRQGYYTSLIGRTFEFRQIYYDINLKGTLKATVDKGIKLRPEDEVQDEQ